MGDRRTMTPLSGEIMTGKSAGAAPRGAVDAVDADFVTIPREAPSVEAPSARSRVAPATAVPTGLGVLVAADGGAGSRRGGIGFWSAGLTAALAAFWMSGGHALSRHLPLLSGGAEPVRIAELSSRVADTAGGPRLFIDGEVRNGTGTRVESPELTIDVTAKDGIVTRYRLATGSGPMSDGEARRFSSRLAAPEAGVRSVAVAIDRKDQR
jgi:hypothetical protein